MTLLLAAGVLYEIKTQPPAEVLGRREEQKKIFSATQRLCRITFFIKELLIVINTYLC